jgi:hypothetical protein
VKIAQIAPLYEAVPPKLYGGTERIVAHLTKRDAGYSRAKAPHIFMFRCPATSRQSECDVATSPANGQSLEDEMPGLKSGLATLGSHRLH